MKRLLVAATLLAAGFVAMPAAHAAAVNGYLAIDDGGTGQIFRLSQSGTDITQLTHVPSGQQAIMPRWSPDGQHIAFVIFANGHDRMYTMAWDGTGRHLLRTENPAWDNDGPSYFPDGKRIVFTRCHRDGSGCELATVRTDGTHFRPLTNTGFEVYDVVPDVSPSGRRIAFVRFNADGVHSRVWVMNSNGSGAHPVTAPALEPYSPRWSRDGTKLIVSSNCCRLGGNLYLIRPSGGKPKQITHTPYPDFSGSGVYAPSGTKIAFISDRNYSNKCCADLFLMRANGQHQVKVKTGLTAVLSVDWGRAVVS